MTTFKEYKLGDIADIVVSNVDKKITPNQKTVKLCNFVDVYHNWAITKNNYDSFMTATASDEEISKFSLKKGQVAFTKDSETRDDIGIPAYIAEDFKDVVLGYHTALATPDENIVTGEYLNAFMHSSYIQKYFELNATGSGMRYTLSQQTLHDIPVLAPDLDSQYKIGSLLSKIDRKISVNREINRNLEELAKQIYDYWFVQFDFPNEDGKPYKSSGGKMIWNETLKRDIPIGWEVKKINELAEIQKYQITPKENIEYKHYSLPNFDKYESYSIENGNSIFSDKFFVENGNLLISKLNPWTDRTVWVDNVKNAICSTEYVVLKQKDKCIQSYLNQIAHTQSFIDYCTSCSTGTSHSHRRVKPELMTGYKIPFQENIVKAFGKQTYQIIKKKLNIQNENRNLITLRDELLPLLMSGQVTLNSCLSAD